MVEEKSAETKHHQMQLMLQEFNRRRKQHWLSILLCFFLGVLGAHRFYLKQHRIGVMILLFTIITFALNPFIFYEKNGFFLAFYERYGILFVGVFFIWIIEMFLSSRSTDKANERIREHVEKINEFS